MFGEALIKPNIIARSQLNVGLHATTTQAIQAFIVETVSSHWKKNTK